MSGPLGSSQWMYASGDYEIDQSLRFNDDDSAYLSRTFASAGNRKTWTYSCWIKRANLSADSVSSYDYQNIWGWGNNYLSFSGDNLDCLRLFSHDGSTRLNLITTQVFRDTNSWFHFMFVLDTTQSTEANRAKIYINGEQVTSFSTATYPSQNYDLDFNTANTHYLGAPASNYLDGYLAEVNFIDGTAKAPTDFGKTDSTYGHWKPIQYDGTYGTNGFYLPFNSTQGIIAANGGSIATSGDYKVHTFTSSGTFTPTTVPTSGAFVQYLVVGGGGAAGRGWNWGGGGGAGGMREGYLEVSAQNYTITIGAGGVYNSGGGQGGNSAFGSITATGGGAGQSGHGEQGAQTATSGGSGGGSISTNTTGVAGQGHAGGTGTGGLNPHGGGGGGAGEAGSTDAIMDGGDGRASSITGSSVVYAGGGAGRREDNANGTGGTGGGGSAASGTDGLGGGGGSASGNTNGGSGVVIIRYRFQ